MSSDGSQARLRATNRRQVIDTLRLGGAMTRSALVEATGLSRTTISTLLGELVDNGLVVEDAVAAPGDGARDRRNVGRPAALLRLAEASGATISIDVGARHIAVAVGDLGHRVRAERRITIPYGHEAADALARVDEVLTALLAEAGVPRADVIGAVMGLPAPISRPPSLVATSNILPGWAGLELEKVAAERLGLPVVIENDANLGALAEAAWGAGTGSEQVAYIKVATGIGGAFVQDGALFRGITGTAGEIGHSTVAEDGPLCRCGNRGCLELYAGGFALLDALRPSRPEIRDLDALVDQAQAGDPACVRVIGDAGSHIGVALATLINLVNPGRIVIGGELSRAGEILLEPMRIAARRSAIQAAADAVEIVPADLVGRAELLGGLALVLREPWRFGSRAPEILGAA